MKMMSKILTEFKKENIQNSITYCFTSFLTTAK